MSGWNDTTSATGGDDTWGQPHSATNNDDGWNEAASTGGSEDFQGINPENISKHRNGAMTGACYNCGETGHNKADCTNPPVERAFTGTCQACGEEGHRASACTGVRKIYDENVPVVDAETAWANVVTADACKDVDEVKKATTVYTRASQDITFLHLEKSLREHKLNTYIIAKEQEISDTHTIVNLQGKIDCKYAVSFQFSDKPSRPKFSAGWPNSPEENLERLSDAGYILDRMVPKCGNCGELGHGSRGCTQDRVEREKTEITCFNCKETGHRVRDCTKPREDRNACRNCGQSGHRAADCTEERSAANVECKICSEMGHFAKDCPSKEPDVCRRCGQEGHRSFDCSVPETCRRCGEEGHKSFDCTQERVDKCRNCDAVGHLSRECPKPRDYSRVQCRNCQEYGHTIVRCKKPKPEDDGDNGDNGDNGGKTGSDDWDTGAGKVNEKTDDKWNGDAVDAPAGPSGGWESTVTHAPVAASDGW